MSVNGGVSVQGCAYRVTRLNADGSPVVGASAMVQDDRPLVKVDLKPELLAGVDITPASACGFPIISYKDCDRYKRWNVDISLQDWDPEQMELVAGGGIVQSPGSAGRTFADGTVTQWETFLDSPALAAFVPSDVGRAVSGTGVQVGTTIVEYLSSTRVRMSLAASSTGTNESITLGAIGVETTGYLAPHLLQVACPYGISLEVWQKQITRGTGYQGTTPYASAGSPTQPGSAWIRTGVFRTFLWHGQNTIENKERMFMFSGWAIENPNFGTGPADDWRVGAVPAYGQPVDTSVPWADLADFELPTPLQAGYQTTVAPA